MDTFDNRLFSRSKTLTVCNKYLESVLSVEDYEASIQDIHTYGMSITREVNGKRIHVPYTEYTGREITEVWTHEGKYYDND